MTTSDPFLYLEDRTSSVALDWVLAQNQKSDKAIKSSSLYEEFKSEIHRSLSVDDRIPAISIRNGHAYNFWTDSKNERGLLRRTPKNDYLTGNPNWEPLLDLDQLSKAEGQRWVLTSVLPSRFNSDRCLINLSDGGTDRSEWREFSFTKKAFLEDGFKLEAGKHMVTWLSADAILVSLDDVTTAKSEADYPIEIFKITRSGDRKRVFSGERKDAFSYANTSHHNERSLTLITRTITYQHRETFVFDRATDETRKLNLPHDHWDHGIFDDHLIFSTNIEWKSGAITFSPGDLIAIKLGENDEFAAEPRLIASAPKNGTIEDVTITKSQMAITFLEDVQSRLRVVLPGENFQLHRVEVPDFMALQPSGTSFWDEEIFFVATSFLVPPQLMQLKDGKLTETPWKQSPTFDVANCEAQQLWATSRDGTKIPYFFVSTQNHRAESPCFVSAYGGFAISYPPNYLSLHGPSWLARGGSYVWANIRGGSEFGPKWHHAALHGNRQRAYEDMIAVVEDLHARGLAKPESTGFLGGSNGGLLAGVMLTQRPDLFGAIVSAVPLLDMLRLVDMPPGSLWIGEYGDPREPEAAAYIAKYSPYQNLRPNAKYPPVLFITSTADDRVHPGHARKTAAKMQALGHEALFHEQTTGGHGASDGLKTRAEHFATEFTFLWQNLAAQGS